MKTVLSLGLVLIAMTFTAAVFYKVVENKPFFPSHIKKLFAAIFIFLFFALFLFVESRLIS